MTPTYEIRLTKAEFRALRPGDTVLARPPREPWWAWLAFWWLPSLDPIEMAVASVDGDAVTLTVPEMEGAVTIQCSAPA